ncbi:MAG: glycoside hydrolase domain-containing protein [Candidatus Acidiferrales bacterium]
MPNKKLKEQIAVGVLIALAAGLMALLTRRGNMNPGSYVSPNIASRPTPATAGAALGFDRNDYPGDGALAELRRTFSFSSFWLNSPPGEKSNSWTGKRRVLEQNDFGFVVLFNGRGSKELKSTARAVELGASDARAAAESAAREGFRPGTIIFLDQEEGGRMLPGQKAYIYDWVDGVNSAGFRAGIYCSGMAVKDGGEEIVTARDIQENAHGRAIVFWIYNDACPPSPGCVHAPSVPAPSASGFESAAVWQFAQSPRRGEYTARCAAAYDADGNCYPPGASGAGRMNLDLDSATTSDPSSAPSSARQ